MIVYPTGPNSGQVKFSEVAAAINQAPESGDPGHVDDHARLASLLFDIIHWDIPVGVAIKQDGEWRLARTGEQMDPATFADVVEFAAQPGVRATGFEEGAFADGVTDHVSDSSLFDGAVINFNASGVVGLSYAVANLVLQVSDLMEATQA